MGRVGADALRAIKAQELGGEMNKEERYARFTEEMEAAGLEVTHYGGRSFYDGPAVRVDDIQEAIRASSVDVQWDNMGLGYVVYPR